MNLLVFPRGKGEGDYAYGEIPDYRNSDYYRTGHTRAEVDAFLARTKSCVRSDRFVVLDDDGGSRKKNSDFLNLYGFYARDEQKRLLLGIDVEEFCHSLTSADGLELFVFCPRRTLYKTASGPEEVAIYVKHECAEGSKPFDVVVSMHELERPIDLLFVD